jgi:glycosyltransferase involved in cell wall biosynthesis
MTTRFLTALPVYNEVNHVDRVIDEVRRFSDEVLVVNDGSSDGTAERLAARRDVLIESHPRNLGYGAALNTAFQYSIEHGYDVLVTIDCDGQHEPCRIPRFVAACQNVDMVSGSRYLRKYAGDSEPPAKRRFINKLITAEINRRLGLQLTDAFCGFKAYRVEALKDLNLTDPGYAMPLELWAQASCLGWRIIELPVPLIYLDEKRSFGGSLDDAQTRLAYYNQVLDRSIAAAQATGRCRQAPSKCGS